MMKNITRALALLLALVLILGLVVTGFADGAGAMAAFGGTITVSNTVDGQDYTLYRILDLESYDETANAYSYKPATGWKNFFDGSDIKGKYVEINELGYVTWKKDADGSEVTGVETFAKLAQEYAVNNADAVAGTKSTQNANGNTVVFNSLSLGYYLLDSSLGTLCSLDTTNTEIDIHEKNVVPSNDKQVQEDSKENGTGKGWGKTNDADIGQTVNFKSTITAQAGAQNYVFHDTMSAGLTFDENSVKVTKNTENVDNAYYILKTEGNTVADKATKDKCTFEIVFNQTFCDTLKADDQIVITYSATLNENAVVAGAGNTNESKLSYGDKSETKPSITTTKTWEVKVFKFHTDATNAGNGLPGAIFTLSRNENGTDPIKLIALTDENNKNTYRVATTTEATTTTTTTEITTTDTGKFTIQGLDSGIYYLTETKAPGGYNKLKAAVKITIADDGTVKVNDKNVANNEVLVENKSGTEMPSTGGIGTTVFYVVGGILAVGAAVLLVTKKRMERG